MQEFTSKRVLVTGAAGFVGTHLCAALRDLGADVIAVTRVKRLIDEQYAQVRILNLLDVGGLTSLLDQERPELVVHLAAIRNRSLSIEEFRQGYDANLLATVNLVDACQKAGCVAKFVFIGSCEEYGASDVQFSESARETPASAYGVSKLAATQFVRAMAKANNFPAVILRPSIVYGPGQGDDMFLPALIKSLLAAQPFAMTAGEQTRDYVYVDDLVSAIITALRADFEFGNIINVSSGEPVRMRDVALSVAAAIGGAASNLINFGAKEYRAGEPMVYSVSNAKALQLLSWAPKVGLADGIARTVAASRASMFGK